MAMHAPHIPGLSRIQIDYPDVVNMDVALDAAFAKLGIETLGGASGHGWSRYRDLQKCPHKFFLKHERKQDTVGEHPAALQIGSAFHAFMAIYYQRMIDILGGILPENATPEAGPLCDLVLEHGGNPEYVNEAWRLFDAYATYYESNNDKLIPLAVERHAKDKGSPNTCRYDLIARVPDDHGTIIPGVYVVEHKSASRMSRDVQEGWHLDGEIIGELMLWKRAGLHRKYGPLQGVIVNIVTKTKVPNFHREIVSPPAAHMRRQHKDLKVWKATEGLYRATGRWPRALASCVDRYGFCDYFEHCRNNP